MGFVMPHVFILAGAGCATAALILDIAGVATPVWLDAGGGTSGLWKICVFTDCVDIPSAHLPSWYEPCRAYGILSILAIAACLLLVALICFMSEQQIFGVLAPIAAVIGAFCCLSTFAMYAGDSGATKFGYSFAFVIVAFILCIAAAVLLFLGKGRNSG